MKTEYDSYDLFGATDEYLTRPKFHTDREPHFYPSEASVQVHDEHGDLITHGGCLRASYFRVSGAFTGTPYEARTEYIFAQGKIIEQWLIDRWKEMGIWVGNNIKFLDREHNISGELDVILAEPPSGQLYGAEVKTFYGYMAEKEIFGDKRTKGFPKMSQLLQTLIYVNHFEEKLPYFRMLYFGRDSVKRCSFKVELHHEGNIKYPKVEGIVLKQFSMNDVLDRYKLLQTHIANNTIPPNDYELQYPSHKIEDFFKKGKVAKTKYEAWKKGSLKRYETVGDWQCNYCRYKNECWGQQAATPPEEDSSQP
jgi:hypothetical protein